MFGKTMEVHNATKATVAQDQKVSNIAYTVSLPAIVTTSQF